MKMTIALGVCLFLLFGPIGLGEPASEIEQLIAFLEKKPPVSAASEAIKHEPDEYKRFEYLQQKWQDEAKHRQAVQDTIDQLAAMGDMAVDPIVRKMKSKDRSPEFTGYALMVLGKINTPKSQQALLSIALGKNGISSSMSFAIEYYVKNLKDKSQAIVFLKSNDDGLIEDVLNSLRGSSIDDPLFSSLEYLMQSNRFDSYGCVSIKEKTARILASDPNVALANRKMKAIVAAMETVEDMPGAHDRYQDNVTGTTAGITYSYLTRALIQVKGLTADSLKPYLEQLKGRAKLCVEIVLADKGDASVKESLKKSVLDIHVDYLIRRLALEKLEQISTHEDLPYFEELSKTDPVEVYIIGESMVEMVDGKPLLKMDEEELEFLNLRLRSTMPITKCFPIRDQCRDIAFRLRP